MGRAKKRTKDHIEILRGGFRTRPPAQGRPSRRAVLPFPAHLCTRPRRRIRGSRARGTTRRTSGHDQRKAKAASQHRIGAALAGDERRLWLCAGHGPKSFLLYPSPVTRGCGVAVECRGGPGREARLAWKAGPAPEGEYETLPGEFRCDPSYAFSLAP